MPLMAQTRLADRAAQNFKTDFLEGALSKAGLLSAKR
jgi:hypothetical protein